MGKSNHSITHPLKAGPAGDQNQYVEAAFSEWLVNGAPGASDFEDGVAPSEYNSSMAAWMEALNNSIAVTGVYIDHFAVSGFQLSQSDVDELSYSYNMDLSMRDKSGTTSVTRTYPISGKVNITGIPDPAIARETAGSHQILGRRFYFLKIAYKGPDSVKPSKLGSGTTQSGQGWFYGYLTDVK